MLSGALHKPDVYGAVISNLLYDVIGEAYRIGRNARHQHRIESSARVQPTVRSAMSRVYSIDLGRTG